LQITLQSTKYFLAHIIKSRSHWSGFFYAGPSVFSANWLF
jgi:hypothetical protein